MPILLKPLSSRLQTAFVVLSFLAVIFALLELAIGVSLFYVLGIPMMRFLHAYVPALMASSLGVLGLTSHRIVFLALGNQNTVLQSCGLLQGRFVLPFSVAFNFICAFAMIGTVVLQQGSIKLYQDKIALATHKYTQNMGAKVIMDQLQLLFQCCGSYGYKDYFTFDWAGTDVLPPNEVNFNGNDRWHVPFSCCKADILKPCVQDDLRHGGIDTVNHRGCAATVVEQRGLAALYLGVIFAMAAILQGFQMIVLCTMTVNVKPSEDLISCYEEHLINETKSDPSTKALLSPKYLTSTTNTVDHTLEDSSTIASSVPRYGPGWPLRKLSEVTKDELKLNKQWDTKYTASAPTRSPVRRHDIKKTRKEQPDKSEEDSMLYEQRNPKYTASEPTPAAIERLDIDRLRANVLEKSDELPSTTQRRPKKHTASEPTSAPDEGHAGIRPREKKTLNTNDELTWDAQKDSNKHRTSKTIPPPVEQHTDNQRRVKILEDNDIGLPPDARWGPTELNTLTPTSSPINRRATGWPREMTTEESDEYSSSDEEWDASKFTTSEPTAVSVVQPTEYKRRFEILKDSDTELSHDDHWDPHQLRTSSLTEQHDPGRPRGNIPEEHDDFPSEKQWDPSTSESISEAIEKPFSDLPSSTIPEESSSELQSIKQSYPKEETPIRSATLPKECHDVRPRDGHDDPPCMECRTSMCEMKACREYHIRIRHNAK